MSVKIKKGSLKVNDNGEFKDIGVFVGDTRENIEAINEAGNAKLNEINEASAAATDIIATDRSQVTDSTKILINATTDNVVVLPTIEEHNKLADDISAINNDLRQLDSRVKTLEEESSVPQSIINDVETLKVMVDSITDHLATATFDGTVAGYNRAMKNWFYQNGVNAVTPQGLTELVDRWYLVTRTGWTGGTVFKQPDASTSSSGEKIGDNAGMTCVPSTSLVAGQDDYASNPLFAVSTVNWILDENGEPLITAIKGIHSDFEQNNPEKYVGVMQMTGYTKWFEDEQTYTHMYSDTPLEGYVPLPEAVRLDGTIKNFVLHSKYISGTVNGKMTCCAGVIPTAFNSHNTLIDLSKKNGALYSASVITDWSFIVYMTMIKYASMTQDAQIQGCVNYNYQYYAKASEGLTNRILLTTTEANNLIVGSSVIVGEYGGNADRGQAALRNMTPNGAIIIAIEQASIDGTTYGAVYLDREITTVSNGNAVSGSTIISTWHWISGTNDDVLGNDGSHLTPENGRYPAMVQGIEYSVGGYETMEDVILNIVNGSYEVYVARTKSLHKTSVQAGMVRSELTSPQPSSDSWNYIRRLRYDGEIFFGTDTTGGSSSTFTRDAFYKNGTGAKTGTREWLAFGSLNNGSGNGGLAYLNGNHGLANAFWHFLARLSSNGNRGELRA